VVFYRLKGIYIDDIDVFNTLVEYGFFSSGERKKELAINAKVIMRIFSEIKHWKAECQNEKGKVLELQNRLNSWESQGEKSSKLGLELEQLKQQQTELISLNDTLQKDIKVQKDLNEKHQKQISELNSVRGVVDTFGTYKSLMKDIKIINYFRKKPENSSIRWKKLDSYFTQYGWSRSTLLIHLRRLIDMDILKYRQGIRGEYFLNLDSSEYNGFFSDVDMIIKFILGEEIYDLFKKERRK